MCVCVAYVGRCWLGHGGRFPSSGDPGARQDGARQEGSAGGSCLAWVPFPIFNSCCSAGRRAHIICALSIPSSFVSCRPLLQSPLLEGTVRVGEASLRSLDQHSHAESGLELFGDFQSA